MKDSPKIGRFPSHHCRNDPHYPIRSYNGSLDSWVIELCRNIAFGHVLQTYAHATPTRSLENHIYTILAPFWEPIWCSKCSENFFYNLRTLKFLIMSHTPTQYTKHLLKQVWASFWKPILAKIEILSKITSCLKISGWYDDMEAFYAYAKYFHKI